MKKCRSCELPKPLSDYHRNKNTPDGKLSRCKECCNEKKRLDTYLKKKDPGSILLKRESFSTKYPSVNRPNFKSWVYRNTEYKSLNGLFGSELDDLVIRFENRPIQLNRVRNK